MANIAIITARGGSKRIPRKNIKNFCGKPIMAYSIEAALNSAIFDEVMVSTDDDEIAAMAKQYGANVPFMRSEDMSNDYAGTEDVLAEVLDRYDKMQKHFDIMCCIYPTAPFVTAEKLQRALDMLNISNADALTTVTAFSYPPQRAFVIQNGFLEYQYPQNIEMRSQDLETIYHDAGQIYFYNVNKFMKNKMGGGYELRKIPMILDETEVQDIDNLSDWELAEMKYRFIQNRDKKI